LPPAKDVVVTGAVCTMIGTYQMFAAQTGADLLISGVFLGFGVAGTGITVNALLPGGQLQDLSSDVRYESADAKVARVTSTGRVLPLANGERLGLVMGPPPRYGWSGTNLKIPPPAVPWEGRFSWP
jgi:hypothetical protein